MAAAETTLELELVHDFFKKYPREVSQLIESSSPEDALELLSGAAVERAVQIFERLSPSFGSRLLSKLPQPKIIDIATGLDPGHTATLLSHLEQTEQQRILDLLPNTSADELKELLSYPPDTAGAIMTTRVVTFVPEQSISDALSQLRQTQTKLRALVVCEAGRLRGMIPLTDAVITDPHAKLSSLVSEIPIHVVATAPREDVVTVLQQTDIPILPVVDPDLRFLGCIDYDSLMRAVREEATVDLQTMVGVSKDERALSTPWFAVRKRLPWLNINLLTAFLAAAVVGLFESTIAKFTALAVLLPVVAGQSGNTGAQALAVTMRGLALREIRQRHSLRVLTKETVAGFLNGVAIAVVTCVGVYIWSGSLGLCFVIGLAMVISMVLAGLSGGAIPLVLTAFKQDPAQSGSIVLTTVTDIVGFFSFLGLATVFSTLL